MNPDLLAFLRGLAPRDATAAPRGARQPMPTMSAPTGTRLPQDPEGIVASLLRSAAPSPDTPGGMMNEMFNPIRAGAQARELVGEAAQAVRQGNLGQAAGMGAMAAMAVPGVPGNAGLPRTMAQLNRMEQVAENLPRGMAKPASRLVRNPAYDDLFDRLMQIDNELLDASKAKTQARKSAGEKGYDATSFKARAKALREARKPLQDQLSKTEQFLEVPEGM